MQREWESQPADTSYEDAGASGWSFASHAGHSSGRKRATGTIRRTLKRMVAFLEPLSVFLPRDRTDGHHGKDYNLTLLALVLFCCSLNFVGDHMCDKAVLISRESWV